MLRVLEKLSYENDTFIVRMFLVGCLIKTHIVKNLISLKLNIHFIKNLIKLISNKNFVKGRFSLQHSTTGQIIQHDRV